MEKMDSEKKCEHVYCYAQSKEWICELCGDEGTHYDAKFGVLVGRYEEIKAKKARGEFQKQ